LTTFAPLYVPASLREAVSDEAWLRAMLDAERALGPDEDIFDPGAYDIEALCEEGQADASPVVPLARALREREPEAHGPATSQDILDTAAMLVSSRARELILAELDGLCAACAGLAETHRSTPMIARTLLQQAAPTTFGLKAAGWLFGLVDARRRVATVVLPAQLGGPAGTLDPALTARFAAAVGLPEPLLPWHVHRGPVRELAAALDAAAATCAKVGLDVVLLAQTEVGEVAESEPGGSSSMPHKRNPAAAVLARACARLVHANAGLLTSGDYEHERAAGAWQAEWPALSAALALTGGAVAAARRSIEGLRVDTEQMAENVAEEDTGAAEALVDRALAHYGNEPA
jgi:3-carboxy-cis,cis-muconate cycloisomerase